MAPVRLKLIQKLFLFGSLLGLQACTNAVPKLSGLNIDANNISSTSTVQIQKIEANPAAGTYNLGQQIEIQITFSDVVLVQNAAGVNSFPPKLKLETGAIDHDAVYSGGSGTKVLKFIYTVLADDSSNDLNYLSKDSFDLNSSTLTDVEARPINKELPVPESRASLAGTSAVVISGTPGFLVLSSGANFPATLTQFTTKQFVTVKNQSNVNVTISSMVFADNTNFNFNGGTYPGNNGTCGKSLASDATCTLDVSFAPMIAPVNIVTNLNISFSDGKVAITNSFSLSGLALDFFNVSVTEAYSNGDLWNTYIRRDGTKFYDASNTACLGTEPGDYFSTCMHSAEIKKVQITALEGMSCNNLSLRDTLGFFNWVCDDSKIGTNGFIYFYSEFLKPGKHLRDLIQANGNTGSWNPNQVEVRITNGNRNGRLYASSSPAAWWNNPVQQLPPNNGTASSTLLSGNNHPVFVIGADQTTEGGYQIGSDGISVVTLGSAVLSQSGASFSNNCKNDGGSTAIGLDVRALFCSYQQKFLWFEVNADGGFGSSANYASAGLILNGAKLSRIQDSVFKNFNGSAAYAAVRMLNSSRNYLSNLKIYNANSAISLSNSSFNLIKFVQAAKIQFTGTTSALALNFADSNKWTDIQISGVNAGNLAYGISSSFSDSNIFQRVIISNIDAQASLGYGTGIELADATNHVLSQVTIAGVEGTGILMDGTSGVKSNVLSHINVMNNTDFGLRLWGGLVSDNVFNSIVTGNNDVNISIYGDVAKASLNNIFNNTISTSSYNSNGSVNIDVNYQVNFSGYTVTNFGAANTCFVGKNTVNTNLTSSCRGTAESNEGIAMSSFVGKLLTDDSTNTVDNLGLADYGVLSRIDHWMNFAFNFRAWARDGNAFPNFSNQGSCDGSFACRIWDWRVKAGSVLENHSFNYTAANADINFSGNICTSSLRGNSTLVVGDKTFMKYAVEIDGDGIGNDNGLCESNESCIYTPNIGAYQGEGSLTDNYCITAASGVNVTNAKIFKYTTTSVP